jgi:hypothetical protein
MIMKRSAQRDYGVRASLRAAAIHKVPARKRTDDLSDLIQVAVRALTSALNDGDVHHPPGSWRTETFENQIVHASKHLRRLLRQIRSPMSTIPDDEDDLSHLICRAVIARALQSGKRSVSEHGVRTSLRSRGLK